jgi:hypothetical protein
MAIWFRNCFKLVSPEAGGLDLLGLGDRAVQLRQERREVDLDSNQSGYSPIWFVAGSGTAWVTWITADGSARGRADWRRFVP